MPDIVVATPGRMIDHLPNSMSVNLDDLAVLILDEADRLLQLGFDAEIKELVRVCPRKNQTMLFSATMPDEVADLIKLSLSKPLCLCVDPSAKRPAALAEDLEMEYLLDSIVFKSGPSKCYCIERFLSDSVFIATMAENALDKQGYQVPLTILVDKERNKVVYAESGNDFVDALLSFLTLPLGTIIASGPAYSSGTANTAGPSPRSAPLTHTPRDAISMPALPHNGNSSKPLMMFGTDGTEILKSPSNHKNLTLMLNKFVYFLSVH